MKQIGLFEAFERERERQVEARGAADYERRRAERIATGLRRPAFEAKGPQDVLAALTEPEAEERSPRPLTAAEGS